MQGKIEFLRSRGPSRLRLGVRPPGQFLQSNKIVFADARRGMRGRGRFEELAQFVDFDQPAVGSWAHGGPLVRCQRDEAVGGKSLQCLDDGRATRTQVGGNPRAFELAAGGQFAFHNP